jgi:hypothetical protein
MIGPGLYADAEGLLAVGEGRDGEMVAIRIPLDPAGLEAAARRITEAAKRLKQAQPSAGGGEKPRLIELRRGAAWN